MDLLSKTEADTEGFARSIAAQLQPGDTLFLQGNLGMGKSVFARALIRAICRDADLDVPSPTFTLVQTYENPVATLWHFDLYRIEDPEEIWELGWEEARSNGIIVLEWPERLGKALAPADRLELRFSASSQSPGQRQITLIPYGTWKERL